MAEPNEGTKLCAEDDIWVCGACGKTSRTQYGFDEANVSTAMRGWDESCMLNAILVKKAKCVFEESGRVRRVEA